VCVCLAGIVFPCTVCILFCKLFSLDLFIIVTEQFSALTLTFLCGHLLKYIVFLESVGTALNKHYYKTILKYQCTRYLNFHVRNDSFLSIRCVVVILQL